MPMRRRMSIRYSMTPTVVANGEPMPAQVLAQATMVLELFTANISIIINTTITEAITLVITIPVAIMAVALVFLTAPLVVVRSSTVIRTVPVRLSWKMNLLYRLMHRKHQVIVEQPFLHQLVPKLRAIQQHHRLAHRLCHFHISSISSSTNNNINPSNSHICFLVHRPAAVVHRFNSNINSSKLQQPNNNIISNLNRELTHRQTSRMSLNLRNHSKLLPVDLQFSVLF